MIIVASQRSNALEMARHLLNDRDNEIVDVHRVHGFIDDTVYGAMQEARAIAKGTKCPQHIFSVSLSAPKDADTTTADYEDAVKRVAEKTGLENQPYVMVFHEKKGRRHCHVVFSRIDAETMTAINLPYFKNKMAELSKELYLEHGWNLPQGHIDKSLSNPLNYSLQEWQQAKRLGNNPKLIKQALQNCWAKSDDRKSFEKAIGKHGYYLAKGDRRGFVAVDYRGEVLSLSRWLGVRKKDLTHKLGDYQNLPDIETVKAKMDKTLTNRVKLFNNQIKRKFEQQKSPLLAAKQQMAARHRHARDVLNINHKKRHDYESRIRYERFAKGLRRVWSHVTGQYRKIERRNELEALECYHRDRTEKDNLILSQLDEQKFIQDKLENLSEKMQTELAHIKEAVFSKLPEKKVKMPEIETNPVQPKRGFDLEM